MLHDTTVSSVSMSQPRKWLAGVFSAVSHGLVVGVLVAVTYARPAALFINPPCSKVVITHLTFEVPPPPPPGLRASRNTSAPAVGILGTSSTTGPLDLDADGDDDSGQTSIPGFARAIGGICGCVEGGIVRGLESDWLSQLSIDLPPPLASLPSRALRAGQGVPIPTKLVDVPPTYPPLARHARIQGVVVLDATIDETGHVVDVRVLRSIALLDRAAIEAVRRWRYAPAIVNGRVTPVVLTVTASFVL
jgi:periplasmic protein TonB